MNIILRIAVVAPLYQLFDYLPPIEPFAYPLVRGLRLLVPFGPSERLGILWEVAANSTCLPTALKPALKWLDTEPLWMAQDLAMLDWTATYYHYPLGEVLALALPTHLRHNDTPKYLQHNGFRLTSVGQTTTVAKNTSIQAKIIALLRDHPAGLTRVQILELIPNASAQIRKLLNHGWIEPCWAIAEPAIAIGLTMNTDQTAAVTAVAAALGKFCAFMLHGVTGSGKTEVYLRLTAQVLAAGGQVLILVPEIGLTPQMQQRLLQRFNVRIALLHSVRSDVARATDWLAARDGTAAVVLGTRSAVFTPMPRLALIVVDEEHDMSFKQQEGLRYSARDLAVWRAQQRGCPIVLGSATPSLETWHNTAKGRYVRLALPIRAGVATSPRFDVIDTRATTLKAGLSPALLRLLQENLSAGQQSLLFLNRRGYAPLFICYNCGWIATCSNCDARLTLHQEAQSLWCHHCGGKQPCMDACPVCNNNKLKAIGQGTERLEQMLRKLFGNISLARIDRDTVQRRGSLEQLLDNAQSGQYQILLGTQMLAKGHHLPGVTLVGILDADHGLYGTDYRAAERMAQLVIQVAGRAGRAEQPGRVVLQTRHPDHPLLKLLVKQDYTAFAHMALQERSQAGLPPFSAHALLRSEGAQPTVPLSFLESALAVATPAPVGLEFWGPTPNLMERRAGKFRAQLLIQAPNRQQMQRFLSNLVPKLCQLPTHGQLRWVLDVDPHDIL